MEAAIGQTPGPIDTSLRGSNPGLGLDSWLLELEFPRRLPICADPRSHAAPREHAGTRVA